MELGVINERPVPRSVPSGWRVEKIGNIAKIHRGGSPRPIGDPRWFSEDSEVGWVRITDVSKAHKYLFATEQRVSDEGIKNSRLVKEDSLIMSICATVGKPIITKTKACIHDGFVVFEGLRQNLDYVYYYLSFMEDEWAKHGQTGSQMNLNTGIIGGATILLPDDPEEQTAIANALSHADTLINNLEKLIAKKRNIKKGAMQLLLTGKRRLPGFSGEWGTRRIGDIFSIKVGKSLSRYILNEGSYIVVDMGAVSTEGKLLLTKTTDFEGDFLDSGDLVMPKDDIGGGNIIGKVAYIDANNRYVLGDHVYAMKRKQGSSRFFSYLINSYHTNMSIRKKVAGSAQLGLSRKSVEEQEVYFPCIEEQTSIAQVLSDINAEIESVERKLAKYKMIKQGMLQELLTGKKRLM